MAKYEELSFQIPGYTPSTIPLGLLIEYMQQLSLALNDQGNLHLLQIKEGSVEPVFQVEHAFANQAREQAIRLQRGEGSKAQLRALAKLRNMIRRDSGANSKGASLKMKGAVLLEISPAPTELFSLSGIRQATTIIGQLIRVGGTGDDATLLVQELDGTVLSRLTAKRFVAKELAVHLWEPVQLSGIGVWGRSDDGKWFLERMQVQSFERLEDEGLTKTLERLRAVKVSWPGDVDERLASERNAAA